MRLNDPYRAAPRRKLRPVVEGLEARDLPSAATLRAVSAPMPPSPPAAAMQALRHVSSSKQSDPRSNPTSGSLIGKGKVQPFLDPNVIAQAATALYGPPPTPQSPNPSYPTQAEIEREEITASAVGRYTVGPPTFSDRSDRIYAYGKKAYSSSFLTGKWQVVLHPPANPNATPNPGDPYANQVTGVAVFIPENFLQTGSGLILDLNENVAPNSDPKALPTHGTWTFDVNSAGGFTGAFGFTQGAGTWTAKYLPDKHPEPGSSGSGQVIFEFQGLYNYSQLISAISKFYS